eukprot:1159863-Pelagomonas_calceolata.AAC.7
MEAVCLTAASGLKVVPSEEPGSSYNSGPLRRPLQCKTVPGPSLFYGHHGQTQQLSSAVKPFPLSIIGWISQCSNHWTHASVRAFSEAAFPVNPPPSSCKWVHRGALEALCLVTDAFLTLQNYFTPAKTSHTVLLRHCRSTELGCWVVLSQRKEIFGVLESPHGAWEPAQLNDQIFFKENVLQISHARRIVLHRAGMANRHTPQLALTDVVRQYFRADRRSVFSQGKQRSLDVPAEHACSSLMHSLFHASSHFRLDFRLLLV